MRRALVFVALLLITTVGNPLLGAPTGQPPQFPTEQAAQQHCPADTVVWLNLPTGIYQFKGQRWYGRTKSGAYLRASIG